MTLSASYYPDEEAQEIMEELYDKGNTYIPVLNTKSPNVILILLESFSRPVITELGGNGEAAPNFNKLIHEGILFKKFFS